MSNAGLCTSVAHVVFGAVLLTSPAAAQPAGGTTTLTFNSGSTVKVEQLLGDMDYQTKKPTASQTVTRFNILGSDIGYSFENNGKLMFSFGDTISKDASVVNYRAGDPLAWTTGTNPDAPLLLNFYMTRDGSAPLFVRPQGVAMGADDVPNSGIALPDGVYLICNTGADTSLPDAHVNDSSVLVKFDEAAQTFTAGRTLSRMPGGHFIITAPVVSGTDVMMFGTGAYRGSDIFLSRTTVSSFATGAGTQYFAGIVNGQPAWVSAESGAAPVVEDNPLNGPAWPNDAPTAANLSVVYSSELGLWLMTYDGGRQSPRTAGVYFTYAAQPWGPWAAPQLIFNANREAALGTFIHDPSILPDPPGDGLNGPTIGGNDPFTTRGGGYAPLLIGRFTTVTGSTLRIQYTLSTWNPYTIVRMRSEFTISRTAQATTMSDVNYFGDRSSSHALDLYLPAGAGPFPLVVFIHGGGWSTGNKEPGVKYFSDLAPRGYAVASINYRLSGEAVFPAQIQDCKAAVRFLRANASKYGIDANRIAVMGDSAGAHLAALVAATGDQTLWDTAGMPNASVSSRVQALVTMAAPASIFTGDADSAFAGLLGCTSVAACPAKVREAEPTMYVSSDDPPALVLQGTNDPVVPPDNARMLDEALVRAGVPVMYRMLPGALHVDDAAYTSPEILGLVGDFLDRVLRGTPATTSAADFEFARFTSTEFVTVFGTYFGNRQVLPDPGPLPLTLGGFSAMVKDNAGRSQAPGLYALLPGQLSMLLPANLAAGPATLTVARNGQTQATETIFITGVAPTLFSTYIDGSAMAVGQVAWTDARGGPQVRSLVVANGAQLQAPPLPFAEAVGPVTVTLYGTGLGAGKDVVAYLKDTKVTVTYAGKQSQFEGVDQYNIQIPRGFAGMGALTLSIGVDGNPATPLRLVN